MSAVLKNLYMILPPNIGVDQANMKSGLVVLHIKAVTCLSSLCSLRAADQLLTPSCTHEVSNIG